MPTLYETTDALLAIDALLEESEGELTPEIEAALELAEGDFNTKVERVALFIRGKLALANSCKLEADRLVARTRAATSAADSLKEYLAHELERAGKQRVDGVLVTVAFQKNPPTVVVPEEWTDLDIRALDPDFVTHTPERFAVNKRAILAAASDGSAIPEGIIITQGASLRIR